MRTRAGPTITVEAQVGQQDAERFWGLYLGAFGALRTRAAARQVLHRHEFLEEMDDPRVHKYVAWDEHGTAVGLSTLTHHLDVVPWISPDYFTDRYPEHAARDAIYYLGFTLVDTSRRRTRLLATMIGEIVEVLVERRAVCAYDICSYNNDTIRFGAHIETLLHRLADVTVEQVDQQTYYSACFSGR